MIKTLTLAAALVGAATVADAQTLLPSQTETIDLGSYARGSAVYSAEPNGYHLHATLMANGAESPIRVDTVLADGQSTTVWVPVPVGSAPRAITFTHAADRLVMHGTYEHDAADVLQH